MSSAPAKKKLNGVYLNIGAIVFGAIIGLLLGEAACELKFVGTIWLNCIKLIMIPLVLCMVVISIGSQQDLSSLGRVATRIIAYYMATTVMAIVIGLAVAFIFKPGVGFSVAIEGAQEAVKTVSLSVQDFFTSLFPSNLFKALSTDDVLGTLVVGIMFGIAIVKIKDTGKKQKVLGCFESLNILINEYLRMVINLSPIGVLCLMADSFGRYGLSVFTTMAKFFGTFYVGLAVQVLLVYGLSLLVFAHMNIFKFLRDATPVWSFTIATCSSTANIPNSIKTAREVFKVPDSISNFSIPLGATLNYDGLCMAFSCVLITVAQMNGIVFGTGTLIHIILVALLLSSCGSGIPGGGVVKIMMILGTFGLPTEFAGLLAGFYRFFDMGITTVNCLGDLVGTVCVARAEERRNKRLGVSQ
ncbi:dicarboxylate/amino acid:cation symporter [Cloacibacillus sp. An23]|uniref:dicarboxylate/amino acid:cation symporter n=1 Tax=Cloacibacillus sp. An23 TaxID=1965591 RepID=UPI000B3854B6|nr:dicarboxylate/amino acid:cation symporter [Cloacibacillus sp. An23]OUO91906.1 hypothetical protein B5F39_12315 [Cloacibacillus sp. An23]